MTKANYLLSQDKQDYIAKCVELVIKREQRGYETRYKSWKKCHDYFNDLHSQGKLLSQDKESACLHLAYYLASWGMYRGSSFVLQYDYSIYEKVVEVIFDSKYDILWNIDYSTIKNDKQKILNLLIDIRDRINDHLNQYRNFTYSKSILVGNYNKDRVSQTLITKILLGTICCCPAFDSFFSSAIGNRYNNFNDDAKLESFLDLIIANPIFDNLHSQHKDYPFMKIVDMAFFNMGIEKEFLKFYNKYILATNQPKDNSEWAKLIKCLKQFYIKIGNFDDKDVFVAFGCDRIKVDEFIERNKKQIDKVIFRLKEEEE